MLDGTGIQSTTVTAGSSKVERPNLIVGVLAQPTALGHLSSPNALINGLSSRFCIVLLPTPEQETAAKESYPTE